MRYGAVLFDLDGTLLDTLRDLADAGNRALAAIGCEKRPVGAYKRYVGDGARTMIRRALSEERRDEATVTRALAAFREEYAQNWDKATTVYPGVAELLDELTVRGASMAVLSNKPDAMTRKTAAHFLGEWRWDIVRGAREGVPLKPDPTSAGEIAAELGLPPHEILYLGDTATDMATAVAAGMKPVGALWGFRDRLELETGGAAAILDRPGELLSVYDAG